MNIHFDGKADDGVAATVATLDEALDTIAGWCNGDNLEPIADVKERLTVFKGADGKTRICMRGNDFERTVTWRLEE